MRTPLKEKYGHWECSSKAIIIASIFSFVFVFVTVIHKIVWTPSSAVSPPLPQLSNIPGPSSHAVSNKDVDYQEIWDNIEIKGTDPKENWYKGEGDDVITLCLSTKCISMKDSCKPNKTFIPLEFSTPGGHVTTYVMSEEEKESFKQTVKPSLRALMILMAEDPSTTLIDIATDDTISSIAVASLGNHVIAVNSFRENVQLLCNGIVDSELTGKCYVLLNPVLDVKGAFNLDFISGGYVIRINASQPTRGQPTGIKGQRKRGIQSIILPDILKGFSFTNAAIRLGRHNATQVLQKAGDFFDQVPVRFVMLSWSTIREERSEAMIYDFLKHYGLQPFSYTNGHFEQLDPSRREKWPDNVIFKREENEDDHAYQSTTYTDVMETSTSHTDMVPPHSVDNPGSGVAEDEKTHPSGGERSRSKNGRGRAGVDTMEESTNHLIM